MNIDEIVNKLWNSPGSKLIALYSYQNEKQKAINIIREYVDCNDEDIDEIIEAYCDRYQSVAHNSPSSQIAREWQNKPTCPTCNSTNIRKIGGLERGLSVATLGAFSKKINKTFKCNNCGYTW